MDRLLNADGTSDLRSYLYCSRYYSLITLLLCHLVDGFQALDRLQSHLVLK